MTVTATLPDGTKIQFAKTPTPADVQEAYTKIKAQRATQTTAPVATQPVADNNATFPAIGDEGLLEGAGKALGNIPSSAVKLGKNLLDVVKHPIDTIKAVKDTVAGGAERIVESGLENTDFGQSLLAKQNEKRIQAGMQPFETVDGKIQVPQTEELAKFHQLGNFINERYGSVEALKKSVIEDPVGVLADIASVVDGAGAVVGTAGKVAKVNELTTAGKVLSKVGEATEPIGLIGKGSKAVVGAVTDNPVARTIKEIIPTATDIQRSQVTKALDLTQGDLKNIQKATGNDVTDFIIKKGLIKATPEEVATSLNTLRKDTMKTVREEVAKVPTVYSQADLPSIKKGLTTILEDTQDVAGLEDVTAEIRALATKPELTLSDVQRAKELVDENANIYSKIGDVKSGAKAKGLDNIRKDLRKFIEDEVAKNTASNPDGAVDIHGLNNDVQTSYAVEDAINTRATRNLTRQKISLGDMAVLFGGGTAFSPAVGIGLYIGKKVIESPSFRLAFTKLLEAKPAKTIAKIVDEIKNKNVSASTQRLLGSIADEAKRKSQYAESASTAFGGTKQEDNTSE